MQKKTDKFCFTLDSFTTSGGTGWYARMDGSDGDFLVETGGASQKIRPDIERPDVFAAGEGNKLCGFDFRFEKPLADGQEVIFREANGGEILRATAICPAYSRESANKSMMPMVEPFIEMDIAKARASLMESSIFQRYHKVFSDILAMRDGEDFKRQIIEVLADMKTTMHLLCAAYLDQHDYGNNNVASIPSNFCPDVVSQFTIDIRGDITGKNWSEPDNEGRWTGKDCSTSLLLPSPGEGNYNIKINILNESVPGAAGLLLLETNGNDIPLARMDAGLPCQMEGGLSIRASQGPYLFMRLHFPENAKSLPAVKIQALEFRRIP